MHLLKRYLSICSLFLLVAILMLSGCGPGQFLGPTLTPTPTFTSTPTLTPTLTPSPTPTLTPTPGVGVAVAGTKYQVVLLKVSRAFTLSDHSTFNASTYTPKAGYAFLVVDVTISKLDKAGEMTIASNQAAIVDESGVITTADGLGQNGFGGSSSQFNYCVSCVTTISGPFDEITLSFVFVLKAEEIDQVFKFQFQDVPLIPFKVK